MNVQAIKQYALRSGLKHEIDKRFPLLTKQWGDEKIAEAMETAQEMALLLHELHNLNKERKPRSDKGQPRFNRRKKKEETGNLFPLPVEDKIVNVPVEQPKKEEKMPF